MTNQQSANQDKKVILDKNYVRTKIIVGQKLTLDKTYSIVKGSNVDLTVGN